MDLAALAPYIDWAPFFQTWDLAGPYPAILKDEVVGVEAQKVFNDAQKMLQKIIEGRWITAHGVMGLYPANSINHDDIALYANEARETPVLTWHGLRQQTEKQTGKPSRCLADFVAPKETGIEDYMGAFCVSTGFGTAELAAEFEKDHDDYNSIMIKAIADRLAEAFAEYLHEKVRKEYWGYASKEVLSNQDLIKEEYKGIRPAPGYPACPDHTEKWTIWDLLSVKETIGVELTDSLAMWPAASVSGYYFANEQAKYFGLGKITEEQLVDFAKRKKMAYEVAKKWLNPNLAE